MWMRMRHWFWERYLNLRYPYQVTDFYTWDSFWDEVPEEQEQEPIKVKAKAKAVRHGK